MPGGGSRLSRLSRDWSILETAEQNRSRILLMSCCSGQSQSIIHHHRRGDSRPDRAGALPLVGPFWWKGLKVTERHYAPLVISHNALLCVWGGRGLGGAANSQLTVNVSSSFWADNSRRGCVQGDVGSWKHVAGWLLLWFPIFRRCSEHNRILINFDYQRDDWLINNENDR